MHKAAPTSVARCLSESSGTGREPSYYGSSASAPLQLVRLRFLSQASHLTLGRAYLGSALLVWVAYGQPAFFHNSLGHHGPARYTASDIAGNRRSSVSAIPTLAGTGREPSYHGSSASAPSPREREGSRATTVVLLPPPSPLLNYQSLPQDWQHTTVWGMGEGCAPHSS